MIQENKTLVVIRHSIKNRGGDRLILDYLEFLSKKGYEIIYWTNEINTSFNIHPGVVIKQIPLPGVLGTLFFTLFFKAQRNQQVLVDLVVMAVCALLRNPGRVIYLAQDWDISYYKNKIIKVLIDLCYQIALSQSSLNIIAVSQELAERLKVYHPQNIKIVSNGIPLEYFYRNHQSSYISQRTKPFVIALYNREDYRKGFDIGLRALRHLKEIRPTDDWEVWIFGRDGKEVEGFKSQGFLRTKEDLRDFLSAVDIYLSPVRSEGFGLTQLEAMACGCLMVTTDAFHLCTHEVNALVSPIDDWKLLADHLNRSMNDSSLFNRLRQNGVNLSQVYDLNSSCEKFKEAIYV